VDDEVLLSEPDRFAGFYARVIETNGYEALVEFPDRARTIAPIASLSLVLRPAPPAVDELDLGIEGRRRVILRDPDTGEALNDPGQP
jgi:hypothetical protein